MDSDLGGTLHLPMSRVSSGPATGQAPFELLTLYVRRNHPEVDRVLGERLCLIVSHHAGKMDAGHEYNRFAHLQIGEVDWIAGTALGCVYNHTSVHGDALL